MATKGIEKAIRAIRRKQNTINKASRAMKRAPKYIFAGWTDKSGSYPEQGGKPVKYIACIHEKGLGPHTEKGMVANTTYLHSKEWQKLYARLVRRGSKKGKIPNYYEIFEKVGEQMKQDLRMYTISLGLVETTRLINTIVVNYRRNK